MAVNVKLSYTAITYLENRCLTNNDLMTCIAVWRALDLI